MAQQTDMTAESIAIVEITGRSYAIARVISNIFHPATVAVLNFLIIGAYATDNLLYGLGWALLALLLQILPTVTFFLVRLRQGNYSDENVSNRTQRHELYVFAFVNLLLSIAILTSLHAPTLIMAVLFSGLAVNVISFFVNLVWKISVHSAMTSLCATTTAIYSSSLGIVFWLCTIAVGWSRVRTRNHTPLQVTAGWAVASLSSLMIFRFLDLL